MEHDEEPRRLFEHPDHGYLIRALRDDVPPAATSARIFDSIRGGPRGGGGGGLHVGKLWPRWLLAAAIGIGVMTIAYMSVTNRVEETTTVHDTAAVVALETPASEQENSLHDTPIEEVDLAEESVLTGETALANETVVLESASAHRGSRQGRAALPSEEELIAEARQHVRSRPSEASRVLSRHARLYRQGVLALEREALRAEIVIRYRDLRDGESALARFAAAYPGSAHIERLRRLLEEHP